MMSPARPRLSPNNSVSSTQAHWQMTTTPQVRPVRQSRDPTPLSTPGGSTTLLAAQPSFVNVPRSGHWPASGGSAAVLCAGLLVPPETESNLALRCSSWRGRKTGVAALVDLQGYAIVTMT